MYDIRKWRWGVISREKQGYFGERDNVYIRFYIYFSHVVRWKSTWLEGLAERGGHVIVTRGGVGEVVLLVCGARLDCV